MGFMLIMLSFKLAYFERLKSVSYIKYLTTKKHK